jgi:NAD(P)-dependent dehydrogenase (short-subunit alcohol dehydrogenase family)
LATTKVLAEKHAKVYIASRSPPKAELAIKDIKKEVVNANVSAIEMDLSDLDSVKRGAEDFLRQFSPNESQARASQLTGR